MRWERGTYRGTMKELERDAIGSSTHYKELDLEYKELDSECKEVDWE